VTHQARHVAHDEQDRTTDAESAAHVRIIECS